MKKLKFSLVIAALAVFMTLPVFASDDCSHNFIPNDSNGHICSECGYVDWCSYDSSVCCFCGASCSHYFPDFFDACDYCGLFCSHEKYVNGHCILCGLPDLSSFACEHFDINNFLVFVGADQLHYVGCSYCSWFTSLGEALSLLYDIPSEYFEPHQYSGYCFCSEFGGISVQTQFYGLFCQHIAENGFTLYACTDGHYVACEECGYYRLFEDFAVSLNLVSPGSDVGHSSGVLDPTCLMISSLMSEVGIEGNLVQTNVPSSEYFSSSVLSSVTDIVAAAVAWISAFTLCIVSNPLLLVFVICVFVGLGIGLVKRIIRL